jgi:hypothetical protein
MQNDTAVRDVEKKDTGSFEVSLTGKTTVR